MRRETGYGAGRMSRTRRFLGGLGFGLFNQVLVMVVGLWLTPFLLGRVGRNDYGLWLLATQVMSYLMLLDLGVVGLLPRETAYATGRAGGVAAASVELPAMVGHTFKVILCQLPVVAAAAFVAWCFLLPPEWDALRAPLGMVIAAFVCLFPLRMLLALLQGLQDMAFLGAVQVGAWVLGNALMVGMVLAGFGLHALALGWIANQVVTFGLCGLRLWLTFRFVLPSRLPPLQWPTVRAWLSRGAWVSVAQVAQILVSGTDLLIIGKLLGPAAVVPYACTGKLVTVLANQPALFMASAQPALSELKASAGHERARLFTVTSVLTTLTLLASGAIATVVLATNRGFVGWWVGPELFAGLPLTALLLASMLLRHWNHAAVYSIFCFGYERRISLTTLLDGAVTVALTALLVWKLGVEGAPIASILGVCLVSLPGNLSALAEEAGVSTRRLSLELWPWFWRFALLSAVAVGVALTSVPQGFVALAVSAVLAGVVYGLALLPLALRPPLWDYLGPRVAPWLARLTRGRWQPAVKRGGAGG